MDLIDYGYVADDLAWFDIPSREGAQIGGPKDLTGFQDEELDTMIRAMPDDADNKTFYRMVLDYWVKLSGTRWNLARREIPGDGGSKLVAIPLTSEALHNELRRDDLAAIAAEVTHLLFPAVKDALEQAAQSMTGDAGVSVADAELLEGLTLEPGSQAAIQAGVNLDPNEYAPEEEDYPVEDYPIPAPFGNGQGRSRRLSNIAN